jgi:FkbM family methyltransferase
LLKDLTKNFKNIDCIQSAVSNETGKIIFYTSTSNTTMNSLIPRDGGFFEVDGYKLKDLIENVGFEKVDFIKMDIEGSEYTVLDEETIKYIGENIPKILIEFHGDPRNTKYANIYDHINQTIPDYIQTFKNMGYEVNHFNWDSIFCHKK